MQLRVLSVLALSALSAAPATAAPVSTPAAATPRDGQHDFDPLFGTWNVTLKRLKHPLHGSHEWSEARGTSTMRPVLGGQGNLEEFVADAPDRRIEAVTLRMYSPTSHQWTIYWGARNSGKLDPPVTGEFKDGRGEFYDQEAYEGRQIYVRFVWSAITATSAHFEQAFSPDGGKTWEVNWICDFTRATPSTAAR